MPLLYWSTLGHWGLRAPLRVDPTLRDGGKVGVFRFGRTASAAGSTLYIFVVQRVQLQWRRRSLATRERVNCLVKTGVDVFVVVALALGFDHWRSRARHIRGRSARGVCYGYPRRVSPSLLVPLGARRGKLPR